MKLINLSLITAVALAGVTSLQAQTLEGFVKNTQISGFARYRLKGRSDKSDATGATSQQYDGANLHEYRLTANLSNQINKDFGVTVGFTAKNINGTQNTASDKAAKTSHNYLQANKNSTFFAPVNWFVTYSGLGKGMTVKAGHFSNPFDFADTTDEKVNGAVISRSGRSYSVALGYFDSFTLNSAGVDLVQNNDAGKIDSGIGGRVQRSTFGGIVDFTGVKGLDVNAQVAVISKLVNFEHFKGTYNYNVNKNLAVNVAGEVDMAQVKKAKDRTLIREGIAGKDGTVAEKNMIFAARVGAAMSGATLGVSMFGSGADGYAVATDTVGNYMVPGWDFIESDTSAKGNVSSLSIVADNKDRRSKFSAVQVDAGYTLGKANVGLAYVTGKFKDEKGVDGKEYASNAKDEDLKRSEIVASAKYSFTNNFYALAKFSQLTDKEFTATRTDSGNKHAKSTRNRTRVEVKYSF